MFLKPVIALPFDTQSMVRCRQPIKLNQPSISVGLCLRIAGVMPIWEARPRSPNERFTKQPAFWMSWDSVWCRRWTRNTWFDIGGQFEPTHVCLDFKPQTCVRNDCDLVYCLPKLVHLLVVDSPDPLYCCVSKMYGGFISKREPLYPGILSTACGQVHHIGI